MRRKPGGGLGVIDHAYEQFASQFDPDFGGFGDEPKFPRPHDLLFLLRYHRLTGEEEALQMVTRTLTAMHRGGFMTTWAMALPGTPWTGSG